MQDLARQIVQSLADRRQLAYCRLVQTRGSTPQKAGAMMLVFADGSQAGTLGGGCVEAEVKRRALAIIDDSEATVEEFLLDNDYGWDDGLICGGRMQVLVQPLVGLAPLEYFRQLSRLISHGGGGTEAVVVDGSECGLPPATSYVFDDQNQLIASTHELEPVESTLTEIRNQLKPLDTKPRPYAAGGVAYLPIQPRCRLVIVGGGHVGKAVSELACELDFDVWVVDDRAEFVGRERFPGAQRCVHGDIPQILDEVDITPDTYCLIVTRGHSHDEQALHHLIQRPARYVGLIGSRRKIKLIFDDLLAEGISPDVLERVYAPVGIDIGSQTVQEIAVSIVAELISHRNRDGQVLGRPRSVPVDR